MKYIFFITALLVLASCGDKDAAMVDETVVLSTFKDKLSYVLGAEQAKMITQSGDPNLSRLNNEKITEGFKACLSEEEAMTPDCEAKLASLYGPYGQDFDTAFAASGSFCIGRLAGSVFYTGWMKKQVIDKIDLKMATAGFNHGLRSADTLIPVGERAKLLQDFFGTVNTKYDAKMMADAAKLPNAKVIDGGIVIETIEAGKGASPVPTDDVLADYILTSAYGDTVESSFAYKAQGREMSPFNLQGVIQGWTMAFQHLQKGGKYRLYIPAELAYREKALCFYIEFTNFGPKGTI